MNKIWLLVPAAGVGSRMQADRPKQYLSLLGQPIIQHTLERLQQALPQAKIVLCLNPDDPYWPEYCDQISGHQAFIFAEGGKERCDTVLNGLAAIAEQADDNDWVLVHDVARPCVRAEDIQKLVNELSDDEVGGILALPVADTMKRAEPVSDDNNLSRISETVDRNRLWHALTPQMFRYGLLRQSLNQALEQGAVVTDEASAIEWAGYQPALVAGQRDNIKVTHPDDLYFAELFLTAQGIYTS